MPIRPENRARYPADWKLRSYFVRFVRARGYCEWCGAEHGEPHPVTGSIVVLTCAHVYDDRPEACSLLNLAALCQLCHNRHDAKARQLRRRERQLLESGQRDLWPPTGVNERIAPPMDAGIANACACGRRIPGGVLLLAAEDPDA